MKRAQVAVIGFVMTIALLLIVFSLFYSQIGSIFTRRVDYEEIQADSEHLSANLLSEGHPLDWDAASVKKLGLLEGDRISLEKLEEFSKIDYPRTKLLLGVKYDYMFFIEKNDTRVHIPEPIFRNFFGWNGQLQSYGGNGGSQFDFFFGIVKERAVNIAKNEKFIYLDEATVKDAKLVVYTWSPLDLISYANFSCSDGVDNDGDGVVDFTGTETQDPDPGCFWFDDASEEDPLFNLTFTPSGPGGVCDFDKNAIMGYSSSIFGQKHFYLPNETAPNKICGFYVNYINVTLDDECTGFTIVRLDKERRGHAQINTYTDYKHKVCIKGNYKTINCEYRDSLTEKCPDEDFSCLFSLSDETNAHLGLCDEYEKKVCCEFT
jgi:hypothetical protein